MVRDGKSESSGLTIARPNGRSRAENCTAVQGGEDEKSEN